MHRCPIIAVFEHHNWFRWGLVFLSALSVWPSKSCATSIYGRFTTALYTFERAVQDTVTSASFRAYQTGRIRIRGIGRPDVSFQAYGRVSDELAPRVGGGPVYRLYHGYFHYREKSRFAKVGRQTILSGVGVGRIDGLRLGGRVAWLGEIDVYAGSLVRGGEGVSAWSDGHMYGARLITDPLAETVIGLSYYRRNREATPYESEYRQAAGLPGLEIRAGEVEQEMFGVDVRRQFGSVSGYFRWDLSIPGRWRIRRLEGVLRYRHGKTTLSADFIHRTPYVDGNSLFYVFARSGNEEYSVRGNYRFNRHFGLYGAASLVDYAADRGTRVNVGARVLNGYVGYVGRRGAGGVSDGISSTLRKTLHERAWAEASVHFTRFRTTEAGGTRSTVASQTLSVHFRASRHLSLAFQGQNLSQDLDLATRSNPFQGNGHDLRFFFSATGWFFSRGTGE